MILESVLSEPGFRASGDPRACVVMVTLVSMLSKPGFRPFWS